jgi:hypothetical protein
VSLIDICPFIRLSSFQHSPFNFCRDSLSWRVSSFPLLNLEEPTPLFLQCWAFITSSDANNGPLLQGFWGSGQIVHLQRFLWSSVGWLFGRALSLCSHPNSFVTIWQSPFFGGTGVWTQGLYLEPLHQPFLLWWDCFQDRVSQTICLGLALNHDPPNLYLLSSQYYKCEPLAPGSTVILL